jgi:hypothetical protein
MKMPLIRLALTLGLCLSAYRFVEIRAVEACAGGCSSSASGSPGTPFDGGSCGFLYRYTCRVAVCNSITPYCVISTCGTGADSQVCHKWCGGDGGGINACGSDPSCNESCSGWTDGSCSG